MLESSETGCFRYHKGTDFQANHNVLEVVGIFDCVVLDTTKVLIFKQITTGKAIDFGVGELF